MNQRLVDLDATTIPTLDAHEVGRWLQRGPLARGFWTDEEMLDWSAVTSVPLLKKLQEWRAVAPQYVPIEGGGRRRAWTLREVLRAAAVIAWSEAWEVPSQFTAQIVACASPGWMDRAIGLTALSSGAPSSGVEPQVGRRVAIVDQREAWIELESGRYELLADGLVIRGRGITVRRARAKSSVRSESELIGGATLLVVSDLWRLTDQVRSRAVQDLLLGGGLVYP